jgi:hypothetical protein
MSFGLGFGELVLVFLVLLLPWILFLVPAWRILTKAGVPRPSESAAARANCERRGPVPVRLCRGAARAPGTARCRAVDRLTAGEHLASEEVAGSGAAGGLLP